MSGTSYMRRTASAPAILIQQENVGEILHEDEEDYSFIMMLTARCWRLIYWILTSILRRIFDYTDRQENPELLTSPQPQPHRRTISVPDILIIDEAQPNMPHLPSTVRDDPTETQDDRPDYVRVTFHSFEISDESEGSPPPTFHLPTVGVPPPPAQPLFPVPPPIVARPAPPKFFLLKVLAVVGAITVGYANSFIGGVFSTPIFVHKFFRSLYRKQMHERSTDFCTFVDSRFLLLASTIRLCACVSLWIAFGLSMRWGRRVVLLSGSVLPLVGAASILLIPTTEMVIIGLITIGFGYGFLLQVIPTVCGEHVPKSAAKYFGLLFGCQSIGVALAYATNFVSSYYVIWGWRIPFGVLAVLSLLLFGVSLFVNETPKYLVQRGREQAAHDVLRRMRVGYSVVDVEAEWTELVDTTTGESSQSTLMQLQSPQIRPILVIKAAAQLLPLVVATVPVMFFGPLVSVSVGPVKKEPFVTPLIAGFLGLLATLVASYCLRQFRSRRLLLIGASILILASQIGLWIIFTFCIDPLVNLKKTPAMLSAAFLISNSIGNTVLVHPHGWINCSVSGVGGPVIGVWLSSLSLLFSGVMSIASVNLLCLWSGWLFLVGGVFTVILLMFVHFFVPETTRVDKTMLARVVWSKHWFWKRYVTEQVE